MKKLVVMALIALTAGVVASVALATHSRYTANGVVPMFCGAPIPNPPPGEPDHAAVYTIAPTTELKVRLGWAVKNQDQATLFLSAQKLTWTVTRESDGQVLASRVPNPEYGDTTNWSGPVYQEIVDGNGRRQKIWLSSYQAATGVYVLLGETVRITYSLTADKKTDDGFGFKFNAYETMTGGSTCTVTGVTPPS